MSKDEIIELWLDAEEENRIGTDESIDKCLEMKDNFSKGIDELSKEDKQYVIDYLDSVGA